MKKKSANSSNPLDDCYPIICGRSPIPGHENFFLLAGTDQNGKIKDVTVPPYFFELLESFFSTSKEEFSDHDTFAHIMEFQAKVFRELKDQTLFASIRDEVGNERGNK